jgi:hypothetical protein
MNERIRELAKEAGLQVTADGKIGPAFFSSVDAGYKKFSELIVRDCALIAGLMEHEGRKNIGAAILDRFGVE